MKEKPGPYNHQTTQPAEPNIYVTRWRAPRASTAE
jgi:hypothetical protein